LIINQPTLKAKWLGGITTPASNQIWKKKRTSSEEKNAEKTEEGSVVGTKGSMAAIE